MDVTSTSTFTETQITVAGRISYTPLFEDDPTQVSVIVNNGPEDVAELDFAGYGLRDYYCEHDDSWSTGTIPIRIRVYTDNAGTYQDFDFEADVPDFGS
jgi:hypothetical protein